MKILTLTLLHLLVKLVSSQDDSSLYPLKIQTTENTETRIVGGVEARKHEFPWLVRVQHKSGGGLLCGGAVISSRSILTAAHCISNPKSDVANLQVLAGAHDVDNAVGERDTRQLRDLKKIICHKDYNARNMQNDVCILRLKSDLQMTQWVNSIPLADEKSSIPSNVTVAGWGVFQGNVSESLPPSRVLRKVTVPTVSNPTCSNLYRDVSGISITSGMMCAGTGGQDSCQGDSGGPLMCSSSNNATTGFFACGIVSFGVGCGVQRYPGVYTRISYYRKWIDKNAAQSMTSSWRNIFSVAMFPLLLHLHHQFK